MRTTLLAVLLCVSGCPRPPESGDVPVRLSVQSNPPTDVTIVPPRYSKRARIELGHTPIDAQPGACIGDTIRLVNVERGIEYEEVIEYGMPGELKLISKTFREPKLKPDASSPALAQ